MSKKFSATHSVDTHNVSSGAQNVSLSNTKLNTADADLSTQSLLTINEARMLLRISRPTIYRLIREGRIPATRLGWKFYVSRDVVQELISRGVMS